MSTRSGTVQARCDGPYAVVVDQHGDLWASLVHSGRIARVSAGAVAELIELGNPACRPSQLTVGPDDGIWCTRNGDDRIERVAGPTTPAGRHQCRRSVALPPGSGPYGITTGPDDALWFTAINAEAVGRLDLDGTVRMFELPHAGGMPSMITAGADGALWFTLNRTGAIGRIDLQETITVNALPDPGCGPVGITATSDGIWFVQILAGRVAHLSYNGCLREFDLPDRASRPHAITPAANGGCWLTLWGSNALAHVSADGHITCSMSCATATNHTASPRTARRSGRHSKAAIWSASTPDPLARRRHCHFRGAGGCTEPLKIAMSRTFEPPSCCSRQVLESSPGRYPGVSTWSAR